MKRFIVREVGLMEDGTFQGQEYGWSVETAETAWEAARRSYNGWTRPTILDRQERYFEVSPNLDGTQSQFFKVSHVVKYTAEEVTPC